MRFFPLDLQLLLLLLLLMMVGTETDAIPRLGSPKYAPLMFHLIKTCIICLVFGVGSNHFRNMYRVANIYIMGDNFSGFINIDDGNVHWCSSDQRRWHVVYGGRWKTLSTSFSKRFLRKSESESNCALLSQQMYGVSPTFHGAAFFHSSFSARFSRWVFVLLSTIIRQIIISALK